MADMTERARGRKKIFCDVCSTFISSELLLVMHNNGKKHQRLQRVREARKASTERSIYVRGFENTITLEWDLSDYFSKFGKVTSVFIDKEKAKYAIVEFECQMEAEKILNSKQLPLFNGKHLIIKKRTLKESTKESPKQLSNSRKAKINQRQEKTGSFLGEEVLEGMKCLTTLDEQMLTVVESTCLTEDDLKLRDLIVQYLQEIFVEVFPTCVVTTFGSTTTGLGLKGADIDLCLLVDPESLNQVLDKDDSLQCSSDLTSQVLELIANILRQFAAGFQNVISVATAKCPVVKFTHRDSGLACDLSVNNRLAIRNTELIKSYVALDDRIRPLAITLKNWAAAKRLTGSGGHQISNYCLVLMLLYFLQRTRPPVIPVLQQARESEPMVLEDAVTTAATKMVIDGWDCSFTSTVAERSLNKESLGNLLTDWFHYYGTTFDYVNEVLTIKNDTDQSVLKTSFEKSLSLGAVKSNIFKPSALCVQDPFELSHNLTQNVTVETLRRFIQSCMEAHTTLSSNSEQREDGCVEKNSVLVKLFMASDDAHQRPKKSSYSFTIPYVSSSFKLKGSKKFAFGRLHQTCEFIADLLKNELHIICEFQPEIQAGENLPVKIEPMTAWTCEDEICEDKMCIDDVVEIEDFSTTSGKRLREDEGPDDHGHSGKRTRINDEDKHIMFTLLCKAAQITWQNRRRLRRLQVTNDDARHSAEVYLRKNEDMTGGESSHCSDNSASQTEEIEIRNLQLSFQNRSNIMEVSSPASNTSDVNYMTSHSAVLEFRLTISEHTEKGSNPLSFHRQCNVGLTYLGGSLQQFSNFYGFFKKFVAQKIAECV